MDIYQITINYRSGRKPSANIKMITENQLPENKMINEYNSLNYKELLYYADKDKAYTKYQELLQEFKELFL